MLLLPMAFEPLYAGPVLNSLMLNDSNLMTSEVRNMSAGPDPAKSGATEL